jgi:hypothetical protein
MRISFYCLFCCFLLIVSTQGIAFSQDSNFAMGPQYLMNHGSPLLARPISTPSISLAGPLPEAGASDATGVLSAGAGAQNVPPPNPDALPKIDLFPIYYGGPPVGENRQISFSYPAEPSSLPAEIPPSISDNGVWQMTTAQELRERGYGVALAEAATNGKTRSRRANRVYTNADIERLHAGS